MFRISPVVGQRYFIKLIFLLTLNSGAVQAAEPAAGAHESGKVLVEAVCTSCHSLSNISQSLGYSEANWRALILNMIDLSKDPQTLARITGYLAAEFPPKNKRPAKMVKGDYSVTFKEWLVPTLGQRARDPVEAKDGAIWWAGQWGNLIGRLDPQTGQMQEFSLPNNAMPHTVTIDAEGKVWYTGNKNGTVGKLDPVSGHITEYKMPDPLAVDPHTAVFDRQGTLFFTLQQSNMIGRLKPQSGDIKLVTLPTPNARPYGIKVAADGTLWVACNGSNCLVQVEPNTMALKEFKLPGAQTKVRRLDIDSKGIIWYGNASLGKLGRFDPTTTSAKEWPSPSGLLSHPYGMVVVDDVIWYNESGVRPDMLVRFDPKTEVFQSWPIPSSGLYAGILRHVRATKDGNLLIHQTATNRILLVDIKNAGKSSP